MNWSGLETTTSTGTETFTGTVTINQPSQMFLRTDLQPMPQMRMEVWSGNDLITKVEPPQIATGVPLAMPNYWEAKHNFETTWDLK